MSETPAKPSDDFNYYAGDIYWNNFNEVLRRQNIMISGDGSKSWGDYVRDKYGRRDRGFFFNCGNGWVERDCFAKGLIKEAIAFDIMPKSVAEAREAASSVGMPATYLERDANTFEPEGISCDLIVNVGAMHHVSHINRLTEILARIAQGGIYVGYDYTGPHRNQHGWDMWSEIVQMNARLPEKYRATVRYAHMPTMLAQDPSEAVHSELQMEVLHRHFDVLEAVKLGGSIAYHLLFNNRPLHSDQSTPEGANVIRQILDADLELMQRNPDCNLFTFFVARPRAEHELSREQRSRWQLAEQAREAASRLKGGRYYPPTALEIIYSELADVEWRLRHLEPK